MSVQTRRQEFHTRPRSKHGCAEGSWSCSTELLCRQASATAVIMAQAHTVPHRQASCQSSATQHAAASPAYQSLSRKAASWQWYPRARRSFYQCRKGGEVCLDAITGTPVAADLDACEITCLDRLRVAWFRVRVTAIMQARRRSFVSALASSSN
jgi:hypothetical protein